MFDTREPRVDDGFTRLTPVSPELTTVSHVFFLCNADCQHRVHATEAKQGCATSDIMSCAANYELPRSTQGRSSLDEARDPSGSWEGCREAH